MRRPLAISAIVALALLIVPLLASTQAAAQDSGDLQVTVRNVTSGQPITPPIAVVHSADVGLLPSVGDLDGFDELAEAGSQEPLATALGQVAGVSQVVSFAGGPIMPGRQATAAVSAMPGDHVSVIAMLACTNDAITVGTAVIPASGSLAMSSGAVLDAGTETNDETSATVACFGQAGGGVSDADGEGAIAAHMGIGGGADLTQDEHGWYGPAVQIIVTAAGTAAPAVQEFGLTLENLTGGQPIAPPVVVVHDSAVGVLDYSSPDELDGIANLAEGGVNADLLATFSTTPGVVRAYALDTGGPIHPGASYTAEVLHGLDGATVTVVAMLACTNDAYIRASLPLIYQQGVLFPELPATALVFDAGSENNDETAATVPCLGGEALSEGLGEGMRAPHAGIAGTADLDAETYGWTADSTALLTVHNAVKFTPQPIDDEDPDPGPLDGGDYALSMGSVIAIGLFGAVAMIAGLVLLFGRRRTGGFTHP